MAAEVEGEEVRATPREGLGARMIIPTNTLHMVLRQRKLNQREELETLLLPAMLPRAGRKVFPVRAPVLNSVLDQPLGGGICN